ncbi:hypothetical protein ARMGADRAFT_946858, partial [Armillaria gallica]
RSTGTVAKPHPIGRGQQRSLAYQDAQYLLSLAQWKLTIFLNEYCQYIKQNRFLGIVICTIHRTFECAGLSIKHVQKMAKEHSPVKWANFV